MWRWLQSRGPPGAVQEVYFSVLSATQCYSALNALAATLAYSNILNIRVQGQYVQSAGTNNVESRLLRLLRVFFCCICIYRCPGPAVVLLLLQKSEANLRIRNTSKSPMARTDRVVPGGLPCFIIWHNV